MAADNSVPQPTTAQQQLRAIEAFVFKMHVQLHPELAFDPVQLPFHVEQMVKTLLTTIEQGERYEHELTQDYKKLRADVDAANARAAAAERERDALMQAARDVVGEFDNAPDDYSGAWEVVPSAESLNALYALLYPSTVAAQPADGSAAEWTPKVGDRVREKESGKQGKISLVNERAQHIVVNFPDYESAGFDKDDLEPA